jgi:hypothetical protein
MIVYCRKCQYNLRGLTERRCPECGQAFDPADSESYLKTIPPDRTWEHATTIVKWLLLAGMAGYIIRGCYKAIVAHPWS